MFVHSRGRCPLEEPKIEVPPHRRGPQAFPIADDAPISGAPLPLTFGHGRMTGCGI